MSRSLLGAAIALLMCTHWGSHAVAQSAPECWDVVVGGGVVDRNPEIGRSASHLATICMRTQTSGLVRKFRAVRGGAYVDGVQQCAVVSASQTQAGSLRLVIDFQGCGIRSPANHELLCSEPTAKRLRSCTLTSNARGAKRVDVYLLPQQLR